MIYKIYKKLGWNQVGNYLLKRVFEQKDSFYWGYIDLLRFLDKFKPQKGFNFMEKEEIMRRFLIKLINLNIWGGRHTELTNLKKCIAKHMRGDKIVEKAIKDLVRLDFLRII